MIINVTVAASGTTSNFASSGSEKDCYALVGVILPASLTSTTMTIQPSNDGTNALTHYDYAGAIPAYPVAASVYLSVDPALYKGCNHIRVVLGSAEAADRTIGLVFSEVA